MVRSHPLPSSDLDLCKWSELGQGEPATESAQGQGRSAGQERTVAPRQHRAALMKGQAAGMHSDYADRGLIGLMRCSVVKCHSTEQDRTGRNRAERPAPGRYGSEGGDFYYYCQVQDIY